MLKSLDRYEYALKCWILFQQAAVPLDDSRASPTFPAPLSTAAPTGMSTSARGLPAVYIYPDPSAQCRIPPRSLAYPFSSSYTTFARALFVHIFASLFCVFRCSFGAPSLFMLAPNVPATPPTPPHTQPQRSPSRPSRSISRFYSLQYLGEKICFMDTGSLLLYTLLYI